MSERQDRVIRDFFDTDEGDQALAIIEGWGAEGKHVVFLIHRAMNRVAQLERKRLADELR